MKSLKKICLMLFIIIITSLYSSCNLFSNFDNVPTIGVYMPCGNDGKWKTDAEEISDILTEQGYEVILFFANHSAEIQNNQLESAADSGVDVIIVSALDVYSLHDSLDIAKKENIKIIAYDRLPFNTDAVDYFVSFDNYLIGVQQGLSLVEGLIHSSNAPYNVELFAGAENDSNAVDVYKGAMSILEPLIESGDIVVPSGKTSMHDITNNRGDNSDAVERLENLLDEYYSDGTPLNGILSPRDSMTLEFIQILENSESYASDVYPVMTGQNAEVGSVCAISNSKQYSTVYKDYHLLADIASSMAVAVLNGETPEINDTTSFYNGVKTVPAFLCEPILINKSNFEQILIDTGCMSCSDINP